MNITSMLVRLQGALGCSGLTDQIVLWPHPSIRATVPTEEVNLVVGYNSSPKSQTALDLTLWIAHQTRLVSRTPVTVQVVYVIDEEPSTTRVASAQEHTHLFHSAQHPFHSLKRGQELSLPPSRTPAKTGSNPTPLQLMEPALERCGVTQSQQFEQADRILWQARCLANEWRGSLKTHLRIGNLAEELMKVVQAETATLLWLGCESVDHSLIQTLGPELDCPILGIPPALNPDRFFE